MLVAAGGGPAMVVVVVATDVAIVELVKIVDMVVVQIRSKQR